MPGEKILICGAGIAGSVLAFWLAKHGFQVVVIERSKTEQKSGQGLEIEEPALAVVTAMGVLDQLKAKKTGELGFNVVDQTSRSYALFEVGRFSPTGALEMMRGDMTEIFYKAADAFSNVEYRFQTTIQSLRQTKDKVIVDLQKRHETTTITEEFDLVVGADGQRSVTRQLLMGPPEKLNCYKPVGAYVAYFSIPAEPQDWPYSRACNFKNRKLLWIRPNSKDSKTSSVYIIHLAKDVPAIRQANALGDRQKQKEAFAELYSGLGWEVPRVMEGIMTTDNFYSDELSQVKLPRWSQDRVVLLGDAAWAPTPFTGQGNQLAIIGAWVLAQELSRNRGPEAFLAYEKRLRTYVTASQEVPLGGYAPYMVIPETSAGIMLLRVFFFFTSMIVRVVSWLKLTSMLPEQKKEEEFDLEMETEMEK